MSAEGESMDVGIDEKIAYIKKSIKFWPEDTMLPAILASLRRLKAIDDAAGELPEEPLMVRCMRDPTWCGTEPTQIIAYIDTLRDLLAAERAKSVYWRGQCDSLSAGLGVAINEKVLLHERAEKAEAELKRIKELLREPSDEMRDAGNEVLMNRIKLFAAWKAMSAALLAQVEREMRDE